MISIEFEVVSRAFCSDRLELAAHDVSLLRIMNKSAWFASLSLPSTSTIHYPLLAVIVRDGKTTIYFFVLHSSTVCPLRLQKEQVSLENLMWFVAALANSVLSSPSFSPSGSPKTISSPFLPLGL